MTKKTIPRRGATAPTDPNALVPHATVLALDPQVLHTQAGASVRALLAEGESANTVRSFSPPCSRHTLRTSTELHVYWAVIALRASRAELDTCNQANVRRAEARVNCGLMRLRP